MSIYQNYSSAIASKNVSFANFMYKNIPVEGGCENWQLFNKYGFSLPVETLQFGAMTLTIGTDDPDDNDDTSSTSNATARCDDISMVATMINALQDPNTGYNYANCNGIEWRARYCDGYPVICADCTQHEPCDLKIGTPGRLITKPCQGGTMPKVASFSVLGFDLVRRILFPEPIVSSRQIFNITANSAIISQNVTVPGQISCLAQEDRLLSVTPVKKSQF